jgi:hypothetical protein
MGFKNKCLSPHPLSDLCASVVNTRVLMTRLEISRETRGDAMPFAVVQPHRRSRCAASASSIDSSGRPGSVARCGADRPSAITTGVAARSMPGVL